MPPATKLTDDHIVKVVRLEGVGREIKALATQFHVGPDRIRRIVADAAAQIAAKAPPPPVIRPRPNRIAPGPDGEESEPDGEKAEPDDDDADVDFIAAFDGVAPFARS